MMLVSIFTIILFVLVQKSNCAGLTLTASVLLDVQPSVTSEKFPLLRFITNNGYNDYLTIRVTNLANLENSTYTSIFNNGALGGTVFFIYGWLDSAFTINNETFTELTVLDDNFPYQYLYYAYFYGFLDSPNFVALNWTAYNTGDYVSVISNLQTIANEVGDQLYNLQFNSSTPIDLSQWHFIGFSLGAHLAGLIARRIKERANGSFYISRITGLDPAGPLLNYPIIACFFPHLDKNDGELKIHSCMLIFFKFFNLVVKQNLSM